MKKTITISITLTLLIMAVVAMTNCHKVEKAPIRETATGTTAEATTETTTEKITETTKATTKATTTVPIGKANAVRKAKEYISGALAAMLDLGKGSGPMQHNFDLTGRFV